MTIYWKEGHQPQDYPFTDKKLKKENNLIMKKKLDMVIPSDVDVTDLVTDIKEDVKRTREYPFTRIEWPDGVIVLKGVRPNSPSIDLVTCGSLETAKKLRTELIRSLELLNYYIDQVEETGEIRYVR